MPEGVLLLRTVDDCLAIRQRLNARPRVVVIGGGFIGAEVAASCRSLGLNVVLIEKSSGPLISALGKEMAQCWAQLHRGHGVDLRVDAGVEAFVGDTHVEAVRLTDGSQVPADLVVVGLGVTPATDWLTGSGLRVDDQGVVCDATGAVENGAGVVAAGDVARWWHPVYEQHLRIEHWDHAGRQGGAAARTLLAGPDRAQPYDEVPYFWSDQYDVKLQTLGVTNDYDDFDIIRRRCERLELRRRIWAARSGWRPPRPSTIPGRVDAYRDAIVNRAEFPPKTPTSRRVATCPTRC